MYRRGGRLAPLIKASRVLLLISLPLALSDCAAKFRHRADRAGHLRVVGIARGSPRGGGAAAQQAVLSEAAAFCQAQGRSVALLDLRPDGDPRGYYWPTAFDATFQCRGAGVVAPAVGRP